MDLIIRRGSHRFVRRGYSGGQAYPEHHRDFTPGVGSVKKHWLEGLAAMTMTEWNQDDRLLADLGGGHAAQMGNLWIKYLGITWDDLLTGRRIARRTGTRRHVPADLEEFGHGENEKMILDAARVGISIAFIKPALPMR